ncbi:hypothetical protein [Bradyrhizobium canariense]|uniref:hypothetical protein n=1 Tax=Bradyrhizobium canariense TaxID=255045 RepID=UPI001B8A777C|nr:hypothetical protein [Bradyrhizobium canariense]MBR0954945.1 hypothetical protein [Bradyrhizobium canariense]
MPQDTKARELDRLEALSDEAFRLELRDWIEANYPPGMVRYPSRRLFWRENREWFVRLSAKGWIGAELAT